MNDNRPWYVYYFPEKDELAISPNIADFFSVYLVEKRDFQDLIAILIGEL